MLNEFAIVWSAKANPMANSMSFHTVSQRDCVRTIGIGGFSPEYSEAKAIVSQKKQVFTQSLRGGV